MQFPLYSISIALLHIREAMQHVTSCPVTHLQSKLTDIVADGANFLRSLVATDRLNEDQIVGITTDLFTAGIDSVSNSIKVAPNRNNN